MSVFVKQTATLCAFTSSDSWVILSPIEQSIKRKIEAVGTPLRDWNIQINYGIKTGCNEAFIIDEAKRSEILANCRDAAERKRTEQIIRPILRGRDVKRYAYNWAGLYLLWIPWHFPLYEDESIIGASEKAELEFRKQFPAVYKHLSCYKDILSKRNQSETGIRYEWYALQRWGANYWDDFAKPKIVWAETMRIHREDVSNFPRFALAIDQIYTDKTCFIGTGESDELKLVLGVLNSKVGRYQLGSLVSKMDDGGWLMQKIFIEKILIPKVSPKHQQRIISLVDKMLNSCMKNDAEHDLDSCIYAIYGLSDNEIGHIEKITSASLTRRG